MASSRKEPKPPPLFSLELGDNGGTLAPLDPQELIAHITHEQSLWTWLNSRSFGNHESRLREALGLLNAALSQAQQAPGYKDSNPDHYKNLLASAESSLRAAFLEKKLPHSGSPLLNEIKSIRTEHGDAAASFFAAAKLDQSGQTYQPTELSGWVGLLEALHDYRDKPYARKISSISQSIDDLRRKTESNIAEQREVLHQIHRDFERVQAAALDSQAANKRDFDAEEISRENAFNEQVDEHSRGMEAIRKAFREEMALRAPAQYWRSKRTAHRWFSAISGIVAFGSIVSCSVFLASEVRSLLDKTSVGSTPEHWRIAVLALMSLFAVWAVRLVVRIFLSQIHLVTDASERIVMLETYLSLIEGDQLTNDGERKLILTALFRPAADGIVKDEGVPPSFIDLLTKNPKP